MIMYVAIQSSMMLSSAELPKITQRQRSLTILGYENSGEIYNCIHYSAPHLSVNTHRTLGEKVHLRPPKKVRKYFSGLLIKIKDVYNSWRNSLGY